MNQDIYGIYFPRTERPSSAEIRSTLESGLESGWTTTRDGDVDRCLYTDVSSDRVLEWESTTTAIEALSTRKRGSISMFASRSDFSFEVASSWEARGLSELGGVSLSWERIHFRDDAEATTNEALDIAALVYAILEPPFAFSYLPYCFERETEVGETDIEEARVPNVYWMMILSEPICKRIGHDRIQSAPAWKTEPLSYGGVGLVATANPYQYTEADKMRLKTALGMDQ